MNQSKHLKKQTTIFLKTKKNKTDSISVEPVDLLTKEPVHA